MHTPSQIHQRESRSVAIQIKGTITSDSESSQASTSTKPNFSAMKIFNRFRNILMRLIFSFPSRGCSSNRTNSKQKNCVDRSYDPPKTSCSSYYSSQSHYSEAIADCIEFFNKSSQEGISDGRNSDDDMLV
ncbi:hypothetical protein Dsin_003667 [Dipteronia sinensis]|uniref:Uncharacterized protein n=1 Tax=Dipteronia sinensis TaxID=43782 RepID=A0AAE0EKK2_9ROSI|nr:hypothetical protein Dsin_003667 [Dipteronia sinensis]